MCQSVFGNVHVQDTASCACMLYRGTSFVSVQCKVIAPSGIDWFLKG